MASRACPDHYFFAGIAATRGGAGALAARRTMTPLFVTCLRAAFAVGAMVVIATTATAAATIAVPRLEVNDCVARNATPIEGRPTVFWSEAEHYADGLVRQSVAAYLMRRFGAFKEGGAVVDIGAGRGGLGEYLPSTTTYVPVDVMGYEGVRASV